MSVVLHGAAYSVYVRIARLALAEKGVAHDLHEVDLFDDPAARAAHLARHPFGKMPVLEHDGLVLYETTAICRYVDEAFDGPALQPADPRERARMNQIVGLLDAYAYKAMVWDVFVQLAGDVARDDETDARLVASGLACADVVLGELERLMAGQRFLAGDALTLADLHAAPMLAYITVIAEGRAKVKRYPGVSAWVETMRERPSVVATRPAEAAW